MDDSEAAKRQPGAYISLGPEGNKRLYHVIEWVGAPRVGFLRCTHVMKDRECRVRLTKGELAQAKLVQAAPTMDVPSTSEDLEHAR